MQIEKRDYIIAGVLCVVVLCGVYLFSSASRYSDNADARLSAVEKQLSDVAEQQRKTTAAIESAQGTAGAISDTAKSISEGLDSAQTTVERGSRANEEATSAVRDATETASRCQELLDSSRTEFDRCAAIFDRVEQSNQSGTSSSGAKGNNP